MRNQLTSISLASLILITLLAGCGVPAPASSRVAEATIARTPTPTATFTPTPTPTFTPSPTPTLTPTTSPKAQAQSQTESPARKPRATATPASVVLVVTEEEANKMALDALAGRREAQIENPAVDFRAGEMYLSGDTTIGFFKLNIGILATVAAADGEPQVTVQEIYVNGGRATGFIRDQIEAMIAPHLNRLAAVSRDFYVEDIDITDDAMIITGRYR